MEEEGEQEEEEEGEEKVIRWKWRGDRDTSFMLRHGVRIWEPFVDADGNVPGAYGWMYRHAFGVDQLDALIARLRARPYGRRAIVQTMHPDYPEPCEQGFACSAVDGQLMMTVNMRSSDFAVGLPYDLISAQMLHHEIAKRVGLPRGAMMFSLANVHFYARHREIMRYRSRDPISRAMPDISLDDGDAYVRAWTGRDHRHSYAPKVAPVVVA